MIRSSTSSSSPAVAIWLLGGVFLLFVQVILGGITRLTGSGLSITEWNIVTGILPPLSESQWLAAFEKYRHTPQYHLLNAGFTVSDFKFIFFWEWFHRLWARMIGLVFLGGFTWLIWRKKMKREMIRPMVVLFLLGALQGAVGWIMVASGLTGDAIYVLPTRLALHFVFALGLISYTFWFALRLLIPSSNLIKNRILHRWTLAIVLVLFLQLIYGALMAGNKAAIAAPDWPTINGDWIPSTLLREHPYWQNFVDNKITVQFIHRGLALILAIMTFVWTFVACRVSSSADALHKIRWLPLLIITVQTLLGITTVLVSPGIVPNRWMAFDWAAQIHQVTGILFLLTMTYMIYLVRTDHL